MVDSIVPPPVLLKTLRGAPGFSSAVPRWQWWSTRCFLPALWGGERVLKEVSFRGGTSGGRSSLAAMAYCKPHAVALRLVLSKPSFFFSVGHTASAVGESSLLRARTPRLPFPSRSLRVSFTPRRHLSLMDGKVAEVFGRREEALH